MATNDSRVQEMRGKLNAVASRKRAAARTSTERTLAGLAMSVRFVNFIHAIERANRVRARFALHTERLDLASRVRFQQVA